MLTHRSLVTDLDLDVIQLFFSPKSKSNPINKLPCPTPETVLIMLYFHDCLKTCGVLCLVTFSQFIKFWSTLKCGWPKKFFWFKTFERHVGQIVKTAVKTYGVTHRDKIPLSEHQNAGEHDPGRTEAEWLVRFCDRLLTCPSIPTQRSSREYPNRFQQF